MLGFQINLDWNTFINDKNCEKAEYPIDVIDEKIAIFIQKIIFLIYIKETYE